MYKVLIIDDEPWSREVVKSLGQWESLDLEVTGEGEDGTEGLRKIAELKPDIVITDMRMPGIEGVELLKTINEQFPHIKIIVMSGYDDFVYLRQAIHSRAMEYLLKPINPEELNTSLMQCVEELNQVRDKTNVLWGASTVFNDTALLKKYISFRQLVYGHLLDIDKAAVIQTFENMRVFMEKSLPEVENENVLSKIGHDFIIMLEEFMSEGDFGLENLWNEKNSEWAIAAGWKSIAEVIIDICWLYEKAIDSLENMHKNKNRLDLTVVKAYIDSHFQDSISLETIAQRFYVSKEHLSRVFKSFFGENISDYILRKRMEKAKELILGHKMAIKSVSQMMGYEDIAYFYRVFKKHFGVTPGELRKED
jgi:Response regulator containing CheY-like receiver domain and AraC-type DNA-binding domain